MGKLLQASGEGPPGRMKRNYALPVLKQDRDWRRSPPARRAKLRIQEATGRLLRRVFPSSVEKRGLLHQKLLQSPADLQSNTQKDPAVPR